MDFFIYLCLFSTYVHGKPTLNTFHHIIHTGRPVPGVSTYGSMILLSVSHAREQHVRHMTYICHLQTLNHTYKHNLAPHAGFPMILALRRSFTSETLDQGGPQIYPYSFLRTRMVQWAFLSIYVCLAHMYMENQG